MINGSISNMSLAEARFNAHIPFGVNCPYLDVSAVLIWRPGDCHTALTDTFKRNSKWGENAENSWNVVASPGSPTKSPHIRGQNLFDFTGGESTKMATTQFQPQVGFHVKLFHSALNEVE